LEVPYKGNRKIVDSDTIDNRPDSTAFSIYYTTDGSTPSISDGILYTEAIEITETTTLKAIAVLEGDTNWFYSEVMEETYNYTGTANKINTPKKSFITNKNFPVNTPLSIYNPRGRILFTSQNPSKINNFIKNNSGVYIVKYVNKGKAVVRKVLFTE